MIQRIICTDQNKIVTNYNFKRYKYGGKCWSSSNNTTQSYNQTKKYQNNNNDLPDQTTKIPSCKIHNTIQQHYGNEVNSNVIAYVNLGRFLSSKHQTPNKSQLTLAYLPTRPTRWNPPRQHGIRATHSIRNPCLCHCHPGWFSPAPCASVGLYSTHSISAACPHSNSSTRESIATVHEIPMTPMTRSRKSAQVISHDLLN